MNPILFFPELLLLLLSFFILFCFFYFSVLGLLRIIALCSTGSRDFFCIEACESVRAEIMSFLPFS